MSIDALPEETSRSGSKPKVYLTRAGRDGEDEDYALENGLAIIGFTEFSSFENLADYNSMVSFVRHTKPEFRPSRRRVDKVTWRMKKRSTSVK